MSAAAPTAPAGAEPKKGKKKLIVIVAVVLLLALAGAGAAFFLMKSKAAPAEDGEDDAPVAAAARTKADPKHPPVFLPLDPFVVNLSDKDAERYAQIGITLEVDTTVFADQMKTYMPAVRNAILMVLAHKTSKELLGREGKEALAAEIRRESVRPMGIEIDADDDAAAAGESHGDAKDAEPDAKPKAKKKRRAPVQNPVQHVHFSNFVIQ